MTYLEITERHHNYPLKWMELRDHEKVQNRPTIKRKVTKRKEKLRREVVRFEEMSFKLGVKRGCRSNSTKRERKLIPDSGSSERKGATTKFSFDEGNGK